MRSRFLWKNEDGPAPGITTETRKTIEEEKDFLSNIIQTLIDAYGVDLTGDDKMDAYCRNYTLS